MLVLLINGLTDQKQKYQQYEASLPCGTPSSQAGNCRSEAYLTVVDKWDEDVGEHGVQENDWHIKLRSNVRVDYDASFETGASPPRVYRLAPLGSIVYAELWHGDVMRVYLPGGATHFTDKYPGPTSGTNTYAGSYAFIGTLLFFVFLLLFLLVFGTRKILLDE